MGNVFSHFVLSFVSVSGGCGIKRGICKGVSYHFLLLYSSTITQQLLLPHHHYCYCVSYWLSSMSCAQCTNLHDVNTVTNTTVRSASTSLRSSVCVCVCVCVCVLLCIKKNTKQTITINKALKKCIAIIPFCFIFLIERQIFCNVLTSFAYDNVLIQWVSVYECIKVFLGLHEWSF